MNDKDKILAEISEQLVQGLEVSDIDGFMTIPLVRLLQFGNSPFCRGITAEEIGTHIVVNTDNIKPLFDQEPNSFGSY